MARQILKLVKEHEYRKTRTPYKRNKHFPYSYCRHSGTSRKLLFVLLGKFQTDNIKAQFDQFIYIVP